MLGISSSARTSGLLVLGDEVRESHARRARPAPGPTFRRPMNALLAVDVPPISHVTIWGSGPLGINKTVGDLRASRRSRRSLVFCLGTRRKDALVPAGGLLPEHRRVGRRRSCATRSSCRRWAPTASATCRTSPRCSSSSSSATSPRSSRACSSRPTRASAMPLDARARHVGHLQRRRHREAGARSLPEELDGSAGRAEGRSCPLVVVIEFVSTFIVRPFSLMVRLFANMLAGHLILVTFAALTRRAVGAARSRSSSCRSRSRCSSR